MEALAGRHCSYLIFLWKLSIFNFSFGILSHSFSPTVPFSVCCQGCRERAGHRARKRKGVRVQSAWVGPAKQGWCFFLFSFTLFPPTTALLLDKGGRIPRPSPPKPGNPGLLHCVSVLSTCCFHCYLKPVAGLPLSCLKTFGRAYFV